MEDYRSKCPICGYDVIMRLGCIQCMRCEWQGSSFSEVENMTEVRKPGEERFVPPKHIPHPNGRKV